jgi:hypothetical protein
MLARSFAQEIFDEPIRLPGCPQLIVTRGFAYAFLKDIGMDPTARGVGSLEHLVFIPSPATEPLTDLVEWGPAIDQLKERMKRDYA